MKIIKKLLIILVVIALHSCTYTINPADHFVDEDFVLMDRTEESIVINGYTRKIRTWKIVRMKMDTDSMYVGFIDNKDDFDGCGTGIITDELWNSKRVGSMLHFDYIRKNRFHKEKKVVAIYTSTTPAELYSEIPAVEPVEFKTVPPRLINLTKIQIESRILEIDREIMVLKRELETLIESQK